MINYFWNSKFESLIAKVPNKFLSEIAVKLYLGSPPSNPYSAFPKDPDLAFKILKTALTSSDHHDNVNDLRFSMYYLTRIRGIELKDVSLMEDSNNGLKLLCRDEHPAALYVMGKELLMLKDSLKDLTSRKAQEKARYFLSLSCSKNFAPAFYYLGLSYHFGFGGPADFNKALELYDQAKNFGDPQAFFQLSKIEKEVGNEEKEFELLKNAAEIGLLEAQHNLGVFYSARGEDLKALAWFLNAAQYNFFPSMVNVGSIFLKGNKVVLANPMAAYIWFSQAQGVQDSQDIRELVVLAKELIRKVSNNGT
jgi:TPR repeat protein